MKASQEILEPSDDLDYSINKPNLHFTLSPPQMTLEDLDLFLMERNLSFSDRYVLFQSVEQIFYDLIPQGN